MPVTFRQMTSNTATLHFTHGSFPVTITYFPGKVTEEFFSAFLAFGGMDETSFKAIFATFNQQLCEIVKEWDVLENDEQTMYPLDPIRIAALPFAFRMQVAEQITADMRPETIAPQTTTC